MRIGIVCPYSLDVPGGVQNHVKDLAEALIGLGHHVSVLAPTEDGSDELPSYVVAAGKAVPVPYNGSVARLAFGPEAASRTRRWMREGRFDVVHVHEPAAPSLSLLALWAADCPVVATFHSSNVRSRTMSATASILRPSMEKVTARIAVSEYARSTLVQHVGGEPVVIPNGVYVDRFSHAESRPDWHGEGSTLAFVGRIDEPRKGLPLLLAALPVVADAHPGPRLLVVGGGDVDAARRKRATPPRRQRALPRSGLRRREGVRTAYRGPLRRAEHRRGELRDRADRGDGGRDTGARQRHPGLPPRARRRGLRHHVPQRRRRRPDPAGAGGCWATPTAGRPCGRRPRAPSGDTTGPRWRGGSCRSTRPWPSPRRSSDGDRRLLGAHGGRRGRRTAGRGHVAVVDGAAAGPDAPPAGGGQRVAADPAAAPLRCRPGAGHVWRAGPRALAGAGRRRLLRPLGVAGRDGGSRVRPLRGSAGGLRRRRRDPRPPHRPGGRGCWSASSPAPVARSSSPAGSTTTWSPPRGRCGRGDASAGWVWRAVPRPRSWSTSTTSRRRPWSRTEPVAGLLGCRSTLAASRSPAAPGARLTL